ncbi:MULTISPECIES: fumarate hydratase [Oceanotoga]|jgi:fumarate hydratase subunit alpha|uniref:fumarate hydratase n=1 Tax=Oceanotoga TaxID=1255275 RepID=UPI0026550E7D|nr:MULTISPECIES: fumarate hydratase [Oceanotoga]MDN5342155.1 fumarate hydratase subunit alpha [Oceanotoga sp.]MDO7976217.1 fumarate hydratase [Oceanotoga teriensis]
MFENIINKIAKKIEIANNHINKDVLKSLIEYDGPFSKEINENYKISEKLNIPLCQDTGMVEFFVFLPKKSIDLDIEYIINQSVIKAYTSNNFRYSTVKEPLFKRENMKNNSPAIIHYFFHENKNIKIKFLIKGGGSENLSALYMLKPSADKEEIKKIIKEHIKENGARGCPPMNIGIGIGGTSDKAMILSKLALTEDFNERNPITEYSDFEKELINDLNDLRIGFQGLGYGKTVHSVHIKSFPTHIATLPLAISIDCYLVRKGEVEIEL